MDSTPSIKAEPGTKEPLQVIVVEQKKELVPKSAFEKWKEWLDFSAKIAGVLTPIILFFFAQQISCQQREETKGQENLNRVASLLKSFSSKDTVERYLAVDFSMALARQRKFPLEVISSLGTLAVSTADTTLRKRIVQVLDTLYKQGGNNQEVSIQTEEAYKNFVRVSIEYTVDSNRTIADSNRARAYRIKNGLVTKGYAVDVPQPHPEQEMPDSTQIRFYRSGEEGEVIQLQNELKNLGLNAKRKAAKHDTMNIKPYTFELYINK